MRSCLTRSVFRRLLSSEPLVQHRHIHRPSRVRPLAQHGRLIVHHGSKRSFFGLFDKPQRDLRQPLLDPGMDRMLELEKRIHLVARLPPPDKLAKAWNAYVTSKFRKKVPLSIEDFHAVLLLQTFQSIEARNEEANPPWLSNEELKRVLVALCNNPAQLTKVHNQLARAIYQALRKRTNEANGHDVAVGNMSKSFQRYVSILCQTGDSLEIRALLMEHRNIADSEEQDKSAQWAWVLQGLAKENNEEEIERTIQIMQDLSVAFTPMVRRILTAFYAMRDDVEQTKKWCTESMLACYITKADLWSGDAIYRVVLEFCLRNKEMEWGQHILTAIAATDPAGHPWDAIFRAAAATGRSVDEIDKMIGIMAARSEQGNARPDILTFNGLLQLAMSRHDYYTAERYFTLAEKWNVTPNAQTYILQIDYRLSAGDLEGAQSAYSKLRDQKIVEDEDWPIMNKLVEVLSTAVGIKNDIIMGLVEDLAERGKLFHADTVLALCNYHLKRDEYYEVVDLLRTHAHHYSISQRSKIRDLLASYTLDPKTDTGRAWDTYMIFHQVFDHETQRDLRNQVMVAFFARGRADLATHVFTRMSRHVRADSRPNVDTYTAAFEGIAANADPEALEVIHNLLKLDTETEPCTRLYNALMLAYTSIELPWRSLEFWEDIARSAEGPDFNSIRIAFRAAGRAPWGYRTAQAIWEKLQEAKIQISKDLFESYVDALASSSLYDDVVKLIGSMEEIVGQGPDMQTIGTVFNAAVGVVHQEKVQDWAVANFPKIWEQLEAQGMLENEMGLRKIKGIDRVLRA